MKEKMLKIALKLLMNCIVSTNGHEISKRISEQLTEPELEILSATFKEAEIRKKERRERL